MIQKEKEKRKLESVTKNLPNQIINSEKGAKYRDRVAQGEFELINRNEATDATVQGNLKTVERAGWYIPFHGNGSLAYRGFFLFHKIVIMFYIPFVSAFISDPLEINVAFDLYLDFVFILEIICTFFIPYLNEQSRIVTDHKKIAARYL